MTTPEHRPCLVCQWRTPNTPAVCDADRSKVRSWLHDLPELYAELTAETDLLRDARPYVATVRDEVDGPTRKVTTHRPADPVGHHLTSTAIGSQDRGGRVSGSKERPLPLSVDRLDLTWRAHTANVHAAIWDDQTGHLSVASVLDLQARRLRTARGKGERLPDTAVPALVRWVSVRLDDACDSYAGIADLFGTVRVLRSTLRAVLGHIDVPDYKRGIPCRACDSQTLFRVNGSDWVECGSCPELLTPDEYHRWTGLLAANSRAA